MEYSESSSDSMETKPDLTNSSRKKSKPWTITEEIALSKAWVDVLKEPETDSFWKRILDNFNKQLGGSDRTVYQVNSKWKNMNISISKFNAIYNNKITQRQTAQSDSDIMKLTQIEYQNLYKNKSFPHEAAWEIVKNHPEWTPSSNVPLMDDDDNMINIQPLKRTKTSESNTFTTSLNAEFPDDFYEEGERKPQENLKKPMPSFCGQQEKEDQLRKIISEFTEFSNVNKEDVEDKKRHRAKLEEIKAQKLRIIEEHLREKRWDKDMRFYVESHEHLSGAQLNAVLVRKREIAKRWGWE
ncbi:hypothetical protein LXL04_030034 [Taraxacum kok-saghyz]